MLMPYWCIALNKIPGVYPIGIRQIWRWLMAKTMARIATHFATDCCGTDQLCVGLKSGIEGGVHAATQFWKKMAEDPGFGIVLVDIIYAFNEIHRVMIIEAVCHEWAIGLHFVFNCYHHDALLVVNSHVGAHFFLCSMEGITQGDPLAVIIYGRIAPPPPFVI